MNLVKTSKTIPGHHEHCYLFRSFIFYRMTLILQNGSDKSRNCNLVLKPANPFDKQQETKRIRKQIKWPNKNVVKTNKIKKKT